MTSMVMAAVVMLLGVFFDVLHVFVAADHLRVEPTDTTTWATTP